MIDSNLNSIINNSITLATNMQHNILTTEHIFLSILENNEGKNIIDSLGGNLEEIKIQIINYLNTYIQKSTNNDAKPVHTIALERIFNTMVANAEQEKRELINIYDLLFAIASDKKAYSTMILEAYGINKDNITKASTSENTQSNSALALYTRDLIQLAKDGKIDPVIGRDKEINRVCEILCRRKKNNPILVGEAGVGKTAIAEGIALKITNKTIIKDLSDCKIYALDMGLLIAGTKFRGDFEKRIRDIMDEISGDKNCVIFIDEIHTIVGAGSTGGNSLDVSNILKPALANGTFKCIGATTYTEFRNYFDKDKALSRRFSKVEVQESSIEDSIKILTNISPTYEKFHKIKYSVDAINACVTLSDKFINERFLPDKAIDLLDEAGAYFKIHHKKTITKKDIETLFRKNMHTGSKINVKEIDEIKLLKNLPKNLKSRIFAQDEAIDTIYKSLLKNKAKLSNPDKPISVFLFSGPTGVGKSELAKELARNLNIKFIKFDMSEYSEMHSISKLIGAPAGYVGFEQGGLLVESIRKNPYCVLLLDEIEKAHYSIYNLLLQIFDSATLTDNYGNKADFRNVIVIMTSNVGSSDIPKLGFNNMNKNDSAIKELFTPELRGRLDSIVHFNPLNNNHLGEIIKKIINDINNTLENISLKVDHEAINFLLKLDFDRNLGAREIERLIDKEIKNKLSEIILFNKPKPTSIKVIVKNDKIKFNIS